MSTYANTRKTNDITRIISDSETEKRRFARLLSWLSQNEEDAGTAYESIRDGLINFFCARNCLAAEELADETIDRVARKIGRIADRYTGDPVLYFYGVGKNVIREYYRSPRFVELPDNLRSVDNTRKALRKERESSHLSTCLRELDEEERDLIVKYYDTRRRADDRRRLSESLGITPDHLRVRAYRIRNKLRRKFFRRMNARTGVRGKAWKDGATHRT